MSKKALETVKRSIARTNQSNQTSLHTGWIKGVGEIGNIMGQVSERPILQDPSPPSTLIVRFYARANDYFVHAHAGQWLASDKAIRKAETSKKWIGRRDDRQVP